MERVVLPGRPYPLGATWDGTGVNFALYSENATGWSSVSMTIATRRETGPHSGPGTDRLRLALLYSWHSARPALRLSRSRPLGAGARTALQSRQAADRSLRQSDRRPHRLGEAHLSLPLRRRERRPAHRPPRQRRRHAQERGGESLLRLGARPAAATPLSRSVIYEMHVRASAS